MEQLDDQKNITRLPTVNTNIAPKTKQEEGQLYAAKARRRVGREARKLGTVQTTGHLLALSCCYTAEKTAIHVNKAVK